MKDLLFSQDVNDVTPSFVDFEASYTFLEDLSDATYIEDLDMYELFTVQAEDGDISPEFGNDSIMCVWARTPNYDSN